MTNRRDFLTKAGLGTIASIGAIALPTDKAIAIEEPSHTDEHKLDFDLVCAMAYFSSRGIKMQIITDELIILYPNADDVCTEDKIMEVCNLAKEYTTKYNMPHIYFIIQPSEMTTSVDYDNKKIIITTSRHYPLANHDLDNLVNAWRTYIEDWGWQLVYQYDPDLFANPGNGEIDVLKERFVSVNFDSWGNTSWQEKLKSYEMKV